MQARTILSIATDIRRYLERHPHAADSVEGVARWWLTREGNVESTEEVRKALDLLVERGLVTKRVQHDGQSIFARAQARSKHLTTEEGD